MAATLHDVLARWSDALRERTLRVALILFIGDSISEGWSASDPAFRWLKLLQDMLRARFVTPNNEALGYLPAGSTGTAANFHGAYHPTAVGNVIFKTNAGPGYRAVQIGQTVGEISWFAMTASGGTWTITYQGDTTPALAWDISADDLLAEMNALPSISGDIDSMSFTSGVFDPLFPQSNHWYPFWNIANGNITPGTVDATNLTGGTVTWGTWSQGGIAGSLTYEDLDADLIDVWVRKSDFTNPILVNADGSDVLTITTAAAIEEDSNEHFVLLGSGLHDVEFTEVNSAGFSCELDGLFAYKGDGPSGGYMVLDGNSWVQTPDSVPLSVTGDFGVRFRIDADDLTPSVIQHPMAKWDDFSGNQRSWRAGLTTDAKLRLSWSTDGNGGGSIKDATSTAHNLLPGDWVWITLDVDNGGQYQVKFYKATYETYDHTEVPAWTLISTVDGATGPTSVFNGTSPFAIGNCFSVLPGRFTGKVYAAVYLNGITGGATELANPNYGIGGQRDPDAAGNNYTDSAIPGAPSYVAGSTPAFGIHCVDAAKGGATTLSFAQSDTAPNTRISDWVTNLSPSVGVIALGVNDWATGVTVANYKARLQRAINEARLTDTRLPLLLMSWFEPHPAYHYVPTADYERYVRAMELVANANPLCYHRLFYVDPEGTPYENSAAFRPANVAGGRIDTNIGFGLHPGDDGSETIANEMFKMLVPYRPKPSPIRKGPTNPLRVAA